VRIRALAGRNRFASNSRWVLTLGLLMPLAREDSMPIVDIRFDRSYRQIASSVGDEWPPIWGRDDVLSTGNDDGTSFGGIS